MGWPGCDTNGRRLPSPRCRRRIGLPASRAPYSSPDSRVSESFPKKTRLRASLRHGLPRPHRPTFRGLPPSPPRRNVPSRCPGEEAHGPLISGARRRGHARARQERQTRRSASKFPPNVQFLDSCGCSYGPSTMGFRGKLRGLEMQEEGCCKNQFVTPFPIFCVIYPEPILVNLREGF